jgi:hypothetical protein
VESREATGIAENTMMASVESLPDEILCEIIEAIHLSSNSSHDLFNAIQVSPRFYRLGKEILYKAPRLKKPNSPNDITEWDCLRKHQLRGLLRSLLENPEFARLVRRLEITVVHHQYYYPFVPEHRELPDDFDQVVENLTLDEPKIFKTVPCYEDECWRCRVRSGIEAAMAGVILALTPTLKHLTINSAPVPKRPHDVRPRLGFLSPGLNPHDWYGQSRVFDASAIIGFANLVTLRCTGLVPWSVIAQPSLKALHIVLLYVPEIMRIPSNTDEVSTSVASLTVESSSMLIQQKWPTPRQSVHNLYLKSLTQRLICLETLEIIIKDEISTNTRTPKYRRLFTCIVAPTLRSLMIDTQKLEYSDNNVSEDGTVVVHPVIEPATTLIQSRFPGLLRIVAAQHAFLKEGFTLFCSLPASIKYLEVIDPTESFGHYLTHSLADSDQMPNLVSIVIWRDRNSEQTIANVLSSHGIRDLCRSRGIYLGRGVGGQGWRHLGSLTDDIVELKKQDLGKS